MLDNGLRFGELVFCEFFGNHPVSWYVDPLLLRSCNHVKQQTLYFRFMSPCQVLSAWKRYFPGSSLSMTFRL